MPISARAASLLRTFLTAALFLCIGITFGVIAQPAAAQTTDLPTYKQPNFESNVPQNSHTYTQAVLIDVLSALVCNLTGIDPSAPTQPCLGVNPVTSKVGFPDTSNHLGYTPQSGGAIGVMSNMVGALYVPTISSSQYMGYLSDNFGIVKTAHAQAAAPGADCSTSQFGYGFCGLQPIFAIWVMARDFSYAMLVIAFIFLGVGVMLRFKMDARTVMTLQNQIPRVIIAILLITFSYAIAGGMIDLMWTITYAGVNAISQVSPAMVRAGCTDEPGDTPGGQKLSEAATKNLLDNPVSFANRIYLRDCNGVNSGLVNMAGRVSDSFILLMHSIIYEILGWDVGGDCIGWTGIDLTNCLQGFGIWLTDIILILIITVAIFIALFRLWFELIKSYVTFFIFVIMGPIWIVFGLIPGRPLGFEKWFRLIVANLCSYPLVAFILVFARVVLEAVPKNPTPTTTFIPPLVGNPDASAFNVLMAFGAVLIAPTIPSMIRERMGAGKNKFGPTIAAGLAVAAGAATAPAAKTWAHLNRTDSHGAPVGSVALGKAIIKQRVRNRIPGLSGNFLRAGRRAYYDTHGHGGTGGGGGTH